MIKEKKYRTLQEEIEKGVLMNKANAKVLLFDIETIPMICLSWGEWRSDHPIAKKLTDFRIASYAARDFNSGRVFANSLYNVRGVKDCFNIHDGVLATEIWHLFDHYDVIITHNGNRFDRRRVNSSFLRHGLTPPTTYKLIDTYQALKNNFGFESNSQDEVARELGGRRKTDSGGMEAFWAIMNPKHPDFKKSWVNLLKYNIADLDGLEDNYRKLRPYINNHPNLNVVAGTLDHCPKCHGTKLVKRGTENRASGAVIQTYKCKTCGARPSGGKVDSFKEKGETVLR